jgi:hypothetical protein
MPSLTHLASGFGPTGPRLTMGRDDESVSADLDFHFLL